jgi:hypothetical protein
MMRWGVLAAVAAAGALLLAAFVATTGSVVAVVGALAVAVLLTVISAALLLRARAVSRGTPHRPPLTEAPGRRRGPLPPMPERARPDLTTAPGGASPPRTAEGILPATAGVRAAEPPEARPAPSAGVAAVARELAQTAVQRTGAPAASVLVARGRRLVAAGTAGDWALARQLQAETREAPPGWPGQPGGAERPDDAEPPEFPMDDAFPALLALYGRAAPVERWIELEDAPPEVLPLAGLSDRGAGVVLPLAHARELVGLWVLAKRPKSRTYTDSEILTLERLARQAAPALGAAIARDAS